MTHEPECPLVRLADQYAGDCTYCDRIRAAYRRGYNDHARTIQHWQDTHGAYRAAETDNPFINDATVPFFNQHGEGTNP